MNQIIIPASPDPLDGTARKLHFTGLQIKPDLNMLLTADVVYYAEDGRTMLEAIEQDENLTRAQKLIQLRRYATQGVRADTSGVWVDAQGNPVELSTEGQPPAGSIPELQFWQSITVGQMLAGQNLPPELMAALQQINFSQLFYGALSTAMNNMDSRKRF